MATTITISGFGSQTSAQDLAALFGGFSGFESAALVPTNDKKKKATLRFHKRRLAESALESARRFLSRDGGGITVRLDDPEQTGPPSGVLVSLPLHVLVAVAEFCTASGLISLHRTCDHTHRAHDLLDGMSIADGAAEARRAAAAKRPSAAARREPAPVSDLRAPSAAARSAPPASVTDTGGDVDDVGDEFYACARCGERVARRRDEYATGIMGANEPAVFFTQLCRAVALADTRVTTLSTGRYTLRDLGCAGCAAAIGWQYVHAENRA